MDAKTKKIIGVVLILLGVAAIGVIAWDYFSYLDRLNNFTPGLFKFKPIWRWTSGEIFQIIAGFISIGAGIIMQKDDESNTVSNSNKG